MTKRYTVHGMKVAPTTGPGEAALREAIRSFRQDPCEASQRMVLWILLRDRTSAEDLRNLCFLLDLDYDTLPGDGRSAKAREIVAHYERRKDLDALADALYQLRPDLET
jgi:hypothetical protein